MRRLTVLVDIDDTIWDLLQAWVDRLNDLHGTSVRKDDVVSWDITEFFPGLSKTQVFAPLHDDDFWGNIKPFNGAAKYLQALKDDGHRVLIVTASDYRTIRSKMENVLFKYFPMFSWGDVIITMHKQLINGDVLVDDAVHNLTGGNYEKLLMDAPHNRKFNAEANGMTRVMDWVGVYEKVCELSRR